MANYFANLNIEFIRKRFPSVIADFIEEVAKLTNENVGETLSSPAFGLVVNNIVLTYKGDTSFNATSQIGDATVAFSGLFCNEFQAQLTYKASFESPTNVVYIYLDNGEVRVSLFGFNAVATLETKDDDVAEEQVEQKVE